jgi:hypothetical protein
MFTNCHGPQCCSRVSTWVFGKSNRNLEYVIIFFNISVTSFRMYKHPKNDFLAAYDSRTGNGLVKNSMLPSAANSVRKYICIYNSRCELSLIRRKKNRANWHTSKRSPFLTKLEYKASFMQSMSLLRSWPRVKMLQSLLIEIFQNAMLGTSFAVAEQSIRQSSICYCELLRYDI